MATSASGKVSRQILAQFLELDDASSGAARYPTQAQIADSTGKARAQISQVITKARDRWRRSVPALTPIRTELADYLAAEGGIAEVGELAQFLLASRRSDAPEPIATRRAAAVVRAALEAEKPSETRRFSERRRDEGLLVALRKTEEAGGETERFCSPNRRSIMRRSSPTKQESLPLQTHCRRPSESSKPSETYPLQSHPFATTASCV